MTLSLFDEAPPVDPRPVDIAPWKQIGDALMYHGDCLAVLQVMPSDSIDACVTDPPYGIGFMGKEWDTFSPESIQSAAAMKQRKDPEQLANLQNVYGRKRSPAKSPSQIEYDRTVEGQRGFQRFTEAWGREVLRVLKPGGHAVVCGAPRSAHRMVSGLEDAGFEIRDSFAWLFAQGFPKSHNLKDDDGLKNGWGTALKPGHESICVARKPPRSDVDNTVAVWGVGALNIDACRLAVEDDAYARNASGDRGHADNRTRGHEAFKMTAGSASSIGRWPANVLLDEHAASLLDEHAGIRQSGANPTRRGSDKFRKVFGTFKGETACTPACGADRGGVSRFFFVAKPSRAERDFGCADLPVQTPGACTERVEGSAGRSGGGRNFHPTVKPVALMRWLVRLVTPPNGTVLDPFLGSGTTGMACVMEGTRFIGIEQEPKYLAIAEARIGAVIREIA